LTQRTVNSTPLADTVSQLRLRRGLAIRELAAKSGVPAHIIREIESGDSYVPSVANTVKLALVLRFPASSLLAQRERTARFMWEEP
jgi:transcriptional regulator with XRE-family HTH domain